MQMFKALQETTVDYREITEYNPTGEFAGIKAITYDGACIGDKKTKIFAYLGFPQNVSQKVPAVVLVHGGGGNPFLEWIHLWNQRGYAAIAMSTTGDFPIMVNTGDYPEKTDTNRKAWQYGMHGIFLEEGYTDAPNNDGMQNSGAPLCEQWMYHAVSQVTLAHNILRQDSRVDSNKIGITGISWGGVITSVAIGYDSRYAFAIPVYGSGYLTESMGYIGDYFRGGDNPKLWLAEKHFDDVKMPVLWQCWNDDSPFSLNSNSLSYLHTLPNNSATRLSMVHEMHHAHFCAWERQECYAYADSVCKGGAKLPTFCAGSLTVDNPDGVSVQNIKLYYIEKPIVYEKDESGRKHMNEAWKILECPDGEIEIPQNAREYYLEITSQIDGEAYITTSDLRRK